MLRSQPIAAEIKHGVIKFYHHSSTVLYSTTDLCVVSACTVRYFGSEVEYLTWRSTQEIEYNRHSLGRL